METLIKLLKSRQFWTIVVFAIINGVTSVKEMIPAGFLPYVDGLLGLLTIYFRVSPKQTFQE